MYPKLLDFQPLIMKSIDISLSRNSINPMIVTKGSDQVINLIYLFFLLVI